MIPFLPWTNKVSSCREALLFRYPSEASFISKPDPAAANDGSSSIFGEGKIVVVHDGSCNRKFFNYENHIQVFYICIVAILHISYKEKK